MEDLNENSRYGLLLTPDIKLHRNYFNEMCRLNGIKIIYRAPRNNRHYTTYAEIESNYQSPIVTYAIFSEHPDQQTLKKIGWISELQESSSLIHVAYDLPDIQQGALFIIPSGLDNAKGRLFRCVRLTNSIVYPASITCEIVPEYENTYENTNNNFEHSSFNLLNEEEGYHL